MSSPSPVGKGKIELVGTQIDVNLRVDKLESVAEAVDGVATYAFNVTFKAKEKPEDKEGVFSKDSSHKIYVHAESLDKALQILHVMGHKFKQMNQAQLQHHLQHEFSDIKVTRSFDKKTGTSFSLAEVNPVSGEVKYDEVSLSDKELGDLRKYANYLKSDAAHKAGITDPDAHLELQKKSPYSEVTLQNQDGTTFRVRASQLPEGTTATIVYQEPTGLTAELSYSSAEAQKDYEKIQKMAEILVRPSAALTTPTAKPAVTAAATKSSEEKRIESIKKLAQSGVVSFYKDEFNHDTFIFGNFFESPVTVDGIIYKCKEGAFQAQKFLKHEDKIKFCNLDGDQAREHVKSVQSSSLDRISDDKWIKKQGNITAMKKVLRAFFAPGTHAAEALLATGEAYIVEHTPEKGRDPFWADDNDGSGKNMLGLLLMDCRKALGGTKGQGAAKPSNIKKIIKDQGDDQKVLKAEKEKKKP